METDQSRKELRNLLVVIFSAVLVGILFSFFLLQQFGPSGRYKVSHALLSPDILTNLSYDGPNKKTGGSSRFVFDGLELTYTDKTGAKKKLSVNQAQYENLYHMISKDKSILNPQESVIALFSNRNNSELFINVRTESHAEWQDEKAVFQSLTFADEGNYYSILLHEEKSANGELIYFFHPGILEQAKRIFLYE